MTWKRLRKPFRDREAGQSLAYVLVIGVVLLVLLLAFADILRREMRWIVGSGRRSALLAQADAAVDRAIYALQLDGGWDAVPAGTLPGYVGDVTYTDIPGIKYKIKVQKGDWTPYAPAMGPEAAWTPTGSTDDLRTVTVFVTNTATGERKKIQAVVEVSSLNSALFSGGQVFVSGSADIHWGPIVSYSTASNAIPNPANWTDHPVYMSKGGILISKADACSQGLCCKKPIVGQCVDAYAGSELGAAPKVDVDTLRAIALSLEGNGNHYYYGPLSNATAQGVDPFVCGTNNGPAQPAVMADGQVLFFDTKTGINYDPTTMTLCKGGGIGADIKFTGLCGNAGTLVVMGDLTLAGNGSCAAVSMIPPQNCVGILEANPANCNPIASTKLSWNGFVFVAGSLNSTGTQQLYGSLYAYDSSGVGGNFSIYYKTDNSNLGFLGKSIYTALWMERTPLPTDVFP